MPSVMGPVQSMGNFQANRRQNLSVSSALHDYNGASATTPPFRRARNHSIDCDPTPVRASVRGRRSGRQLDAGSVRFPRAHLKYVLGAEAPATRHRTASSETASWWGPRWPVFRTARSLFSFAAALLTWFKPAWQPGILCCRPTCDAELRPSCGPARPPRVSLHADEQRAPPMRAAKSVFLNGGSPPWQLDRVRSSCLDRQLW